MPFALYLSIPGLPLPPKIRSHISSPIDRKRLTTVWDSIRSFSVATDALMDFTPVTSPPSIRIHDHNANHGRRRSTSRSGAMPFSRAPAPLAIPKASYDINPPPPLPPPRYIDEIAAGNDPGWEWGNDPKEGTFGKARDSAMPTSNFPKSWGKNMPNRPLERPDFRRRESSSSTVRSPSDTGRGFDFARHQDEGYYSLSGPRPSAMSQQSVYVFFTIVSPSHCAIIQGKRPITGVNAFRYSLLVLPLVRPALSVLRSDTN